ncbi:OmpA family protein [Pontibacter locisalis]|uniref:OmpA family protein n=2 Tax=Pontibacter locisalis TaxID=1719035 RepID=A0ABW5IG69_9BACT
MKGFILLGMLLFGYQVASAQQDLYKWRLSGHTGIARYVNDANSSTDYFKTDGNLLYGVELSRNLGNSFGLSLGYTFGDILGYDQQGRTFTTAVHRSLVRGYFYTDNGWLLNSSALVSPYIFGGYGVSILETSHEDLQEESRYVPTIPFGVGMKFRISERWQAALQAEWVYHTERHLPEAALEQNNRHDSYLHTGITIGYSFGFRKSTFKAPQFYVGDSDLTRPVAEPSQPRQNILETILKLESKEVQISSAAGVSYLQVPDIKKTRVDTALVIDSPVQVDSSAKPQTSILKVEAVELVQASDTATKALQTISSARSVIRFDSVLKKGELRPLPTEQQKVVVIVDTLVQVQSTAIPAQKGAIKTQKAASAGKTKKTQVPVKKISEPSEILVVPVPVTKADAPQLREEQLRQATVDAEIRQLQSRLDSLRALSQPDTVRIVREVAVDSSLMQNLQLQVTRTDSLLQRLNQYEQEIALLKKAKAIPDTLAAAPPPKFTGATVFFPINAHRITTVSLKDLKQVLSILQENPDLQVKLTGYASQSGNVAYNMALSRKRVKALENFLTDQGIAGDRIKTIYKGNEEASKKENPLDRKVEIEIIE